jgi:hypothetical protein
VKLIIASPPAVFVEFDEDSTDDSTDYLPSLLLVVVSITLSPPPNVSLNTTKFSPSGCFNTAVSIPNGGLNTAEFSPSQDLNIAKSFPSECYNTSKFTPVEVSTKSEDMTATPPNNLVFEKRQNC